MGDKNFTELLLHTAVCAIASDGVVDEREKEALVYPGRDGRAVEGPFGPRPPRGSRVAARV